VGWLLRKKDHSELLGVYILSGLLVVAYSLYRLYQEVVKNGIVSIANQPPFNSPLGASLRVDMLSIFMAFLFVVIGCFVTAYSIRYMEDELGLIEYYTLILGMMAGMMGTVFAGDFFTLFIFWELMCLTSYALVAIRKQDWEPIEAGLKYLIMSTAGSATILLSMSFLYGIAGTLNFAELASRLGNIPSEEWLYITLTLVIVGFGIKAAMVPFHMWLPDAHSAAPSPISAILSGIMVQTGGYALLRVLVSVFNSFQPTWQITLAIFAIFTMFGGNLMALLQDDIKRLLAYSTIAHMGYILFGFAAVSPQGVTASLFHIMNHAIMKSLLFLSAGALVYRTGIRDLRKLEGIRQTMPLTSIFLAVGVVAIAAIPPLNGFWSETMIILAGVEAGMLPFSLLMVINIILSVAYYLRIIFTIVLKEPTLTSLKATEAPTSLLLPISILAFLCIVIGFYPGPFITLAQKAAEAIPHL
jgi:proton-translocating NADH-quinone oxidoreductase chain N